jgi:uncharacterized membrane protein YkoI
MNRLPYLVTVLDKQYHADYYSIRVQHVDGRIEDVRLDANQGGIVSCDTHRCRVSATY